MDRCPKELAPDQLVILWPVERFIRLRRRILINKKGSIGHAQGINSGPIVAWKQLLISAVRVRDLRRYSL
jgi:hypothetical protein